MGQGEERGTVPLAQFQNAGTPELIVRCFLLQVEFQAVQQELMEARQQAGLLASPSDDAVQEQAEALAKAEESAGAWCTVL